MCRGIFFTVSCIWTHLSSFGTLVAMPENTLKTWHRNSDLQMNGSNPKGHVSLISW